MRRKLLYMSLTGNSREWYRSLDKKYKLDWDILKKAFYLKFYTPKEAYEDRLIFITSGLIKEKVLLKLGGD